jgi:SAM-dependent methyltransferase
MAETREAAPCAVCGATSSKTLFFARDSDRSSPEPFGVVRCDSCGMKFVSPRPAGDALANYYGRGYYDKPGEDSGGGGRKLARLFMAERVAKAGAGRAPGRVLDVGCGEGTFLAAMARRGWDSWGVEVSKEGAARAAARPGVKIFDKPLEQCDFEPKSFDLITLWHSIEHVPDPGTLLKRVAALLKDDGAVFLAFPNGDSWDFRLFAEDWFHLDPPRHLHYFSPESMGRLLEKCDLNPIAISQLSLEYNPFGFSQSALNLMTARFNFLYRKLKGTLAPDEPVAALDVMLTALLFPLAAVASLPYVLLAALFGRSGCVDVRAVRKAGNVPDRGSRPAAP